MAGTGQKIARVAGVAIAVCAVGLFIAASRGGDDQGPGDPKLEGVEALLPPESTPAAPDVEALLGGLKRGDSIGAARVLRIDAPVERIVWVTFVLNGTVFEVGVARKGTNEASPPVTLDVYEMTWGKARGAQMTSPEAVMAVTDEMANRVRATEKTVPVPAGM